MKPSPLLMDILRGRTFRVEIQTITTYIVEANDAEDAVKVAIEPGRKPTDIETVDMWVSEEEVT